MALSHRRKMAPPASFIAVAASLARVRAEEPKRRSGLQHRSPVNGFVIDFPSSLRPDARPAEAEQTHLQGGEAAESDFSGCLVANRGAHEIKEEHEALRANTA